MLTAADRRYTEAFAHEIAAALRAAPHAASADIEVYDDASAESWAVRVAVAGHAYELVMPAPGAIFALFRGGTWVGGINARLGEATPLDVAIALLGRIAAVGPARTRRAGPNRS